MALFQVNFYSTVLGKNAACNVLIPDRGTEKKAAYLVLYLLHGLSDDHSSWLRRSSIERYAELYNIAVVMPDGGRSFYTDTQTGEKYFTFLSEELPEFINRMFPVSTRREDTFAAGLSMGGYGALKLVLRQPERFAAAGIMSAVTDICEKFDSQTFNMQLWRNLFGSKETAVAQKNDLFSLAAELAGKKMLPAVAQFCGTEDFLLQDNRKLAAVLEKSNLTHYVYRESPGTHNWEFWDAHIQIILEYFFKTWR